MATVNLTLSATEVSVSHGRMDMDVTLTAEKSDVLDHFNEVEVVDHFDFEELLNAIGKEACMDHFGLVEDD